MDTDFLIRLERPQDYRETEELVREAFWNVYHPGCTEHYILHCLRTRKEFVPELDFVLESEGKIIGQILYVHSEISCDDGRRVPAMTFGPLCICPDYQGRGFGQKLVRYSMKEAGRQGAGALVITGNPLYYGKVGFVPGKTVDIRYKPDPEADYLLVHELKPGYLQGVEGTFTDPEGYLAAEQNPEEFERFDSTFPRKEKKVLPGQLPF